MNPAFASNRHLLAPAPWPRWLRHNNFDDVLCVYHEPGALGTCYTRRGYLGPTLFAYDGHTDSGKMATDWSPITPQEAARLLRAMGHNEAAAAAERQS